MDLRTHHIVLHELPGITDLPTDEDVVLLSPEGKNVRVILTKDVTAYHLHIRRVAALGMAMMNVFAVDGGSRPLGSPLQRFNEAFAAVQIKKNDLRPSIWLVTDVSRMLADVDLEHLQDYGDFAARPFPFEQDELKAVAERATEVAFAGLTVVLGENVTDTMVRKGDISLAFEDGSPRPLNRPGFVGGSNS